MPSKFRLQRRLKRALSSESTHYKTIQTKYVFKTSFDGHSGLFQTTLISQFLTSLLPKLTLILTKSLTSDPYNRRFLFRRKSVHTENIKQSCLTFPTGSAQMHSKHYFMRGCKGINTPCLPFCGWKLLFLVW